MIRPGARLALLDRVELSNGERLPCGQPVTVSRVDSDKIEVVIQWRGGLWRLPAQLVGRVDRLRHALAVVEGRTGVHGYFVETQLGIVRIVCRCGWVGETHYVGLARVYEGSLVDALIAEYAAHAFPVERWHRA